MGHKRKKQQPKKPEIWYKHRGILRKTKKERTEREVIHNVG